MVRRTVPCDQCRKSRHKCDWQGGVEGCSRCLKRGDDCSGPLRPLVAGTARSKEAPCDTCARSKLRCEWLTETVCVRCETKGKVCPGPRPVPHHTAIKRPKPTSHPIVSSSESASPPSLTSSTSSSSSSSADSPNSPNSQLAPTSLNSRITQRQLTDAVALSLLDVHLAQEGRAHLLGIDCQYVHDAFRLARGRISELSKLNQILSLLFMLSGARYTSHSAIVGSATASLVPNLGSLSTHGKENDLIFNAGLRRESALRTLTEKVWEGVMGFSNLSEIESEEEWTEETIGEVTKQVAVVRLSAKLCELASGREKRRVYRDVFGRTIKLGLKALRSRNCGERDRELLEECLGHLAVREAFESTILGIPSTLETPEFFGSWPENGPPQLYYPTKDDIDLLYDLDVPDEKSVALVNGKVLSGVYSVYRPVLRSVSQDVETNLLSMIRSWWTTLDDLFIYYDDITALIILDPRSTTSTTPRIWASVRTLFMSEHCMIELAFSIHGMVLKAAGEGRLGGDEDSWKLMSESEERAGKLFSLLSRRLQLMLALSTKVSEVFHILDCLVYNADIVGHAFGPGIQALPKEEQHWILRSLKFAGFWAPSASRRVMELESAMSEEVLREAYLLSYAEMVQQRATQDIQSLTTSFTYENQNATSFAYENHSTMVF